MFRAIAPTVMVTALLLESGGAHAEVPAQVFAAVQGRAVVLRSGEVEEPGRLLAITPTALVLARSATGAVVTVPREAVTSLRLQAPNDEVRTLEPETERRLGVLLGLSPTLVVDAQSGAFHGFGAVSLLLPFLTQTDFSGTVSTHLWSFVVGAGVSLEPLATSRLRVDAFASVGAMNWAPGISTGGRLSMNLGVGVGVHYTWPSGLTLAVKVPVLGFDVLDTSNALGTLSTFFANMGVGLPVLSVGYRF